MPTFELQDFLNEQRENLRLKVSEIENAINLLKSDSEQMGENANVGEVFANLTLAKRHAEDARMRLGKVFEALGQKSPYEKQN